jgi:hypothetical protein
MKNIVTLLALCAFGGVAFSPSAHAVKWNNQFTEFELPPQWQCTLEGAEWVCQNTNEAKKRDAIIVLAAKLKGDQDSLDQYLTYLKAAKTYKSVQDKPVKSDPKYAKNVNLSGQPWVDALHLESEIPGFYTRYLATVKQDIGVLITYSVNKTKWQEYADTFDTMIKTLKVFRKQDAAINSLPTGGNIFQQAQIPTNIAQDTVFGNAPAGGAADQKPKGRKSKDDNSLLYIIVAAAAVAIFVIRRRKKQG